MTRTKTHPDRRFAEIQLTRYICRQIEDLSGLSAAELELEMGFGGGRYRLSTPGQRWRRYANGQVALMHCLADQVVRRALVRGWWPLKDDGDTNSLWQQASAGVAMHIQVALQGQALNQESILRGAQAWREQLEIRKRSLQSASKRLLTATKSAFRIANALSAGHQIVDLTDCSQLGRLPQIPASIPRGGHRQPTVELFVCIHSGDTPTRFGYARLPLNDMVEVTFAMEGDRSLQS